MPPDPSRDPATLLDVDAFARRAIDFVRGMSREQFGSDLRTQAAVLHEIMVIGEAVKRLSEWTRSTHPEIPWSKIARMRDMLIHHYDAVDLDAVWKVTQVDLPELLRLVAPLLPPP